MNFLDIILAIPLAYCIWKGWKRGIIFELAALFGVVVGCYAAIHFSKLVAEAIGLESDSAMLIAFFITFVGVVVLSFFLGKCVQGFVKLVKVGMFDKLLGALLGMAKCLCVLSVLISFINLADPHEVVLKPEVKSSSALYRPVERTGSRLTAHLKVIVAEKRAEMNAKKSADNE